MYLQQVSLAACCLLVKLYRKNKVNVNHTISSCSFRRHGKTPKKKKWKSWRRTSRRRKLNFWTVLGGANREIKLQTLEKAALSRAKDQALSSL